MDAVPSRIAGTANFVWMFTSSDLRRENVGRAASALDEEEEEEEEEAERVKRGEETSTFRAWREVMVTETDLRMEKISARDVVSVRVSVVAVKSDVLRCRMAEVANLQLEMVKF